MSVVRNNRSHMEGNCGRPLGGTGFFFGGGEMVDAETGAGPRAVLPQDGMDTPY